VNEASVAWEKETVVMGLSVRAARAAVDADR
jgi:hypothetical protein